MTKTKKTVKKLAKNKNVVYNKKTVRNIKKWEDLDITDDYIFSKFMQEPNTCKDVLEILLPFKVGKIEYIQYQKTIEVAYDTKGIRLDVYVKDSNKTYNVEMQVGTSQNLAKRVRYYEACIDFEEMEKGMKYDTLHDSYVIFICTFDPFGKGLPCYSFNNTCQEDASLSLNDGRHAIFFNAKAYLKEKDSVRKNFLAFVNGENITDEKIELFTKQINEIKTNKEWRIDYMNLALKFNDMHHLGYEEGKEDGKIEGKIEGKKEGVVTTAKNALTMGVDIKTIVSVKSPLSNPVTFRHRS